MAVNADPNKHDETDDSQPASTVRTIVSLLLFIHLFGLAIAIATGSDFGGSDLLAGIKERTPGLNSYLTQFWFHRGYDYHLMNDQPLDSQFSIKATVTYNDGHSGQPVDLMAANVWPGERQQRYRQLAASVARYAARAAEDSAPSPQDTERKSILAGGIGAAILRDTPNAQSVLISCINHRMQAREEARSEDPNERNPDDTRYFSPMANVIVKLDGDQPIVFEALPITDVAPVRKASTTVPKKSGAAGGAKSKSAEEHSDEN